MGKLQCQYDVRENYNRLGPHKELSALFWHFFLVHVVLQYMPLIPSQERASEFERILDSWTELASIVTPSTRQDLTTFLSLLNVQSPP